MNLADIYMIAQQVLGLLFLVAGSQKLINRPELSATLIAGGIHRPALVRGISYGLPWLELSGGLALFLGIAAQVAVVGVGLLLLSFCLFLGANLVAGNRFACSCFGSLSQGTVTWWAVWRNLALIGVGALLFWAHSQPALRLTPSLTSSLLALTILLIGLGLSTGYRRRTGRSEQA